MFSTTHNTNSNTNVPAFIAKLWHMVSNQKSDHLICWNDDGKKFIIKDNARFSSELLPMYYKHNNLASFIRQLNKYGFHKVMAVDSSNNDKGDYEFAHPDFIKGCPSQLSQIKRKLSNNKESEYKSDSILVSKLLQEVQQLQAKQDLFESKLSVMKNENDALWREQSILRQRHQKQQKIVNKLIQFLVTLVQQTRGLNINNRRLPLMLKDRSHASDVGLMAIKDCKRTKSPIICELDPYYACNTGKQINKTSKNGDPLALTTLNEIGRNEIHSIINPLTDEDILDVPSTTVSYDFLEESSSSASSLPSSLIATPNNTNIAVPLQEISPAIVQSPIRPTIDITPAKIVPENETSLSLVNNKSQISRQKPKVAPTKNRKSLKRKHSTNRLAKKDSVLVVPDLSSDTKNSDEQELHEDHLLLNTADNTANSTSWDCSDINCDDNLPIVTSPPSCSELTPQNDDSVNNELTNFVVKKEPNFNDNSLVVSESAPIMNREDIDNHLDMVQSDLDLLKDILHNEGLSLDASTLMGLFSAEDPLSLNFPEAARNVTEENPDGEGGNEVVTYSPALIDMNDILDQSDDYTDISLPSPRELNTPIVEYSNSPSYTSPVPNKRLKK